MDCLSKVFDSWPPPPPWKKKGGFGRIMFKQATILERFSLTHGMVTKFAPRFWGNQLLPAINWLFCFPNRRKNHRLFMGLKCTSSATPQTLRMEVVFAPKTFRNGEEYENRIKSIAIICSWILTTSNTINHLWMYLMIINIVKYHGVSL